MKFVNAIVAFVCVCVACGTFATMNRHDILANGNFVYVYDTFLRTMKIYNKDGVLYPKQTYANQNLELSRKVNIVAKYDLEDCTQEYPVKLTVTNNSVDTVLLVKFLLDVRYAKRSSSLLKTSLAPEDQIRIHGKYSYDIITAPEMVSSACYKLPEIKDGFDKEKMVVIPHSVEITFKDAFGGDLDTLFRF